MDVAVQPARPCPRCRYDLRGLNTPRCPECGLTFDEPQWRSGVLRENIGPALEQCDPWQPHQVLIRSAGALLAGARRPRRRLATLDSSGPLWAGVFMLVLGTFWLYALATVFVTVAILLHATVSPAAAMRWAGLHWAPRAVLFALLVGGVGLINMLHPSATRLARPTWRQSFRLTGYVGPVIALYAVAPILLVLLVEPDGANALVVAWPLVLVVWGTLAGMRSERAAQDARPGRLVRLLISLLALAFVVGLLRLLGFWPDALEPPVSLP